MGKLTNQYGAKKGKRVFYAMAQKKKSLATKRVK